MSAKTSNEAVAVSPIRETALAVFVFANLWAFFPSIKYVERKSCPHSETQWTSSITQ